MEYKDYYKILGITRSASADEIKRAYRKLAREFHPDRNKAKNAEDKFKEINEANEVLGDVKKRQAYDQLGPNWRGGQRFTPPPGWNPHAGAGGFGNAGGARARSGMGGDAGAAGFSDFFSSLFGAGGMGGFEGFEDHGPSAAREQRAKVAIGIEDSYNGATLSLSVGARNLSVRIPKGVIAGQTIRLTGQGTGGGDLMLEVEFAPHPKFRVEGRDIHVVVPVAPWEAALGGKVPVPTLGGTVEFTLPAGVTSGKKLRLKGRGLPGTTAGDEIVTISLVTPPAVAEDARGFYQQMAKQFADFDPRA
jgi:curved DNA-binding protein